MEPTTPNLHTSPSTKAARVIPREGSPGCWVPAPRCNSLPSWKLLRCGDHTAHLPPPGALLTCWICFLLSSSESAAATGHLAEEQMRREHLGTAASGTPGPGHLSPLATLPSVTSPPVLRVFPRFRETSAASSIQEAL